MPQLRILPAGETALLVEVEDLDAVLALSAALRDHPPPGVVDVVPAARTVLVQYDPSTTSPRSVADSLERLQPGRDRPCSDERLVIAASYDGPDIDDVLAATGMDRRELVDWHTGSEWQVAFCGFAPGFGYLTRQPALSIPRRETPRGTVPAGSIGLAGEFSGVYPRASPGGWQLIGHTELTLFDLDSDPPALLRPGVRVCFEERG